MRAECSFKKIGKFYPGRIAQDRNDGLVFIRYDDDDRETTTVVGCRSD